MVKIDKRRLRKREEPRALESDYEPEREGIEHADAGRDGRTCLASQTISGANGDRGKILSPV